MLMAATFAGLPVVLAIVPLAFEAVQVIGMVAVSTMLPVFTAVKEAGDGLTVHTVEGAAEAVPAVRASAAAAAHAATADLFK
ncbi:hypothetical protein GCM10010233_40540 [Streptomyces pseudogriseolus]|uniref:MFS transporter n=1 Tax=Streptomyces pseudogriseolus TaxID=36817 RepID=A0ABQ2SRJ3_STREZ|nr:hypothetical protein GCM10010233_40540 [Streptomyces gancidicus]GGS38005.1 hypothetical protein GCM10010285_16490 [Streptomyces rubiginosus]